MKHLSLLLILMSCTSEPYFPPESCTGGEHCGSDADCQALCSNIERLGCSKAWNIEPADGACLELCMNAKPGLCPALGAVQQSCEDIERVSECGA